MICKGFHTASNSVQNGILLRTILVSRYIVHLDIDIGWIILIWNVMSRPLPIIIICCKKKLFIHIGLPTVFISPIYVLADKKNNYL